MNDDGLESPPPPRRRAPLFGPLPVHGPWTGLGLSREQFLGILLASCVIFVFWGGPLWSHAGRSDFWRLAVSYAAIPALVAAAQAWRGTLRPSLFLAATGVIAVVKLVVTALLDLAVGMGLGPG